MAFLFPWSNLHDVNLDWIIDQLKHCVEAVKKIPTRTSQLINDSGYITQAQASPVRSVNGQTGNVVLDAADVGALPNSYTPPQELFIATYGTTTHEEIEAALTAGKLPVCLYSDKTYIYTNKGSVYHYFSTSSSNSTARYWIRCSSSDIWSNGSTPLVGPASPSFTGTPTAPTAASGTNSTQIATTAFVHNEINNAELITATFSDVNAGVTVAQQYVAKNNQVYSLRVSFHVTAAVANNEILFNVNIPQPLVGGAYLIRSASNGTFAGVNLQAKSSSDHSLCVKAAGNIPVGDWYGLAVTYIGDPAAM